MPITKRRVDALQPGQAIWDDAVRGFGVRKQRRDPVYVLKYRASGKQVLKTIGKHGSPWTPDTARKEALRLLGLAVSGQDRRAAGGPTFETVMEAYLAAAKGWQRPTSFGEINRYLRRRWSPLHAKPVNEIQRRDIAQILDTMTGQTAVQARMSASAMFNWAIGAGYNIASNPVSGTNRPNGAGKRERVLSDEELRAVWRACGDDDYGRVVRLLILTGQRRNEVGRMTWEEIQGDVWTIPGTRTKNKRTHTVPLPPMAIALLGERSSGRLFRVGNWGRAKGRLAVPIAPWTLHDLRRSVATGMADLGVLPHVVEAVLNHVSGSKSGVAGIYNRARYAGEVRDALTRRSDHIAALVGLNATVRK